MKKNIKKIREEIKLLLQHLYAYAQGHKKINLGKSKEEIEDALTEIVNLTTSGKGITDTKRLNFLEKQRMGDRLVVCRDSTMDRGWRLHETREWDGQPSVRKAIDHFMKLKTKKGK